MYLEINSNNQVMGYSEDNSHNSVETDKNIPEFTDTQILKFVNGDFVVEDSQDLIDAKAAYDAQEYARNRKEEYDALNQFELISDDDANGTTTHKFAIAAIKTKWPKDNSGPK